MIKEIPIIPVTAADYVETKCPRYHEQGHEMKIMDAHLQCGVPLLATGPKGVGKTLKMAAWAKTNKIPIVQFDCSENTKRTDLIGRFVMQGDDVMYQLGILPAAIEIANQAKRAILVLEELNALSPAMQKVLNQILDWRKHVYIPELGKMYKLDNGNKLLITATMNPSTYGGVFQLNEDLMSRFSVEKCDYPETAVEKKIIDWRNVSDDIATGMLTLAKETRAGVDAGELDYAISPRDMDMFAEVFEAYSAQKGVNPLRNALHLAILGKYAESKTAYSHIMSRLDSIFDVENLDKMVVTKK